jgi:hypothetical protein
LAVRISTVFAAIDADPAGKGGRLFFRQLFYTLASHFTIPPARAPTI